MSDRRLRELLREAKQGKVVLTDYVAAALREKTIEEIIEDLNGFAVKDVRLAVKQVWVPLVATRNPERVIAADTVELNDDYYIRHRLLLTPSEWRLLGLDYAKHVIQLFEYTKRLRTFIVRLIKVIEAYAIGNISVYEMQSVRDRAWRLLSRVSDLGARYALHALLAVGDPYFRNQSDIYHPILPARNAGISARVAVGSSHEEDEAAWQRERLADYLLGLSALPWQVQDE